jgi:hypothetical protein
LSSSPPPLRMHHLLEFNVQIVLWSTRKLGSKPIDHLIEESIGSLLSALCVYPCADLQLTFASQHYGPSPPQIDLLVPFHHFKFDLFVRWIYV